MVKLLNYKMKGILIFDHLNDVLFMKCNKKFANHIQKLAKIQGLISEIKVSFFKFFTKFKLYKVQNFYNILCDNQEIIILYLKFKKYTI